MQQTHLTELIASSFDLASLSLSIPDLSSDLSTFPIPGTPKAERGDASGDMQGDSPLTAASLYFFFCRALDWGGASQAQGVEGLG